MTTIYILSINRTSLAFTSEESAWDYVRKSNISVTEFVDVRPITLMD